MGQQRSDTANQRAAKQRVADKLRCPSCDRRNALGQRDTFTEGAERVSQRTCRYCGHVREFRWPRWA